MELEGLVFLLLGAFFISVFVIEALVLHFFKVKPFWTSLGVSVIINILSLIFTYYVTGAILTKLAYPIGQFNGLRLPIQGIAFIWWVSSLFEGALISLWFKRTDRKKIFTAAMVMNVLSLLFLYLFITYVSQID